MPTVHYVGFPPCWRQRLGQNTVLKLVRESYFSTILGAEAWWFYKFGGKVMDKFILHFSSNIQIYQYPATGSLCGFTTLLQIGMPHSENVHDLRLRSGVVPESPLWLRRPRSSSCETGRRRGRRRGAHRPDTLRSKENKGRMNMLIAYTLEWLYS